MARMKSKGLMIGAAVVVPAIFLGHVLSTVLLLGSPSTAVNCGPAVERKSLGLVALIAIPGVLLGLIFSMLLLLAPAKPAVADGSAVSAVINAITKVESYTEEQLKNAASIMSAGKALGLSGVTYTAEVARRTLGMDDLRGIEIVLQDLVAEGHLTVHPADEVFADKRPGLAYRLRRPDVVLAVEPAGPLWLADSWIRRGSRGQF